MKNGQMRSTRAAEYFMTPVTNSRSGFASPVVIAIVAAVVIGAGAWYLATSRESVPVERAPVAQSSEGELSRKMEPATSPSATIRETIRLQETENPAFDYETECQNAINKKYPDKACTFMLGAREDLPLGSRRDCVVECRDGGIAPQPMKYSGTKLAGNTAPLLDFTKADYDAAVASGKLVLLYFYANWCPICRAEFPKMQTVFDELTADAVVGFRVNYKDNETNTDETTLAKQFGVAYQHTKVFVRGGDLVSKHPDSWSAERYRKEINDRL